MDEVIYTWFLIFKKFAGVALHLCLIVSLLLYLNAYQSIYQIFDTFAAFRGCVVYDYIIVGGGTAGSLLAARLSERKDISVLLLEAGTPLPYFFDIPVLGSLIQRSNYDWQYKTVPQNHACWSLKENRSRWPAGRALGGSSHLNYLLFVPGHIEDFASWKPQNLSEEINVFSEMRSHWSEEDIRYYFNKSLTDTPIITAPFTTKFSDAVLSAAATLGFDVGPVDLDTKFGFGKSRVYMNAHNSRWTPADYLKHVAYYRNNVDVQTGVAVTKVLIDEKTAYGVEVNINGQLKKVLAQKEVILSAGTIASPTILMRSGVGPKDVLDAAKITTVIDLPVGKNLQDHVTSGLDLIISRHRIFGTEDLISPLAAYNYFVNGKGPYTSALCEAVGVTQGKLSGPPELEFLVMMAGASSDGGLLSREHLGIKDEVWQKYFDKLIGHEVASILPVVLHPKSTGDIRLDPSNPSGQPLINPNYLSHPYDVETLVSGLQFIQKLMKTPEMYSKGFFINEIGFPGCHDYQFGERSYWECYVRQLTLTSYHPVGTCKMGLKDESAVVDHRLRVHGLSGLRVVDASVMPNLPSGNPQAAVLMIAEKAADLIKFDFDHLPLKT